MSAERSPVGSAAEEAARLVEAVSGWWSGHQDGQGQPQPEPGAHPEPGAEPEQHEAFAACRYCPWCRAVAAAQQVRPEVVEHVLGAAEALVVALAELAREVSASGSPSSAAAPGARPPHQPRTQAAAPRTVTIPVEPDAADHPDRQEAE